MGTSECPRCANGFETMEICVYGVSEIKGDLAVVRHYVAKNVTNYEYKKLGESFF